MYKREAGRLKTILQVTCTKHFLYYLHILTFIYTSLPLAKIVLELIKLNQINGN